MPRKTYYKVVTTIQGREHCLDVNGRVLWVNKRAADNAKEEAQRDIGLRLTVTTERVDEDDLTVVRLTQRTNRETETRNYGNKEKIK